MFDGMYLTTRRTSSGIVVDIFRLPNGGRLYEPTVPDWEDHREERSGDHHAAVAPDLTWVREPQH